MGIPADVIIAMGVLLLLGAVVLALVLYFVLYVGATVADEAHAAREAANPLPGGRKRRRVPLAVWMLGGLVLLVAAVHAYFMWRDWRVQVQMRAFCMPYASQTSLSEERIEVSSVVLVGLQAPYEVASRITLAADNEAKPAAWPFVELDRRASTGTAKRVSHELASLALAQNRQGSAWITAREAAVAEVRLERGERKVAPQNVRKPAAVRIVGEDYLRLVNISSGRVYAETVRPVVRWNDERSLRCDKFMKTFEQDEAGLALALVRQHLRRKP